MFGRHVRLMRAWIAATGLCAACGASAESPLAIRLSRSALAAGVTRARIDLHTSDRACEEIARAGARLRASYRVEVDLTGLASDQSGQGEITGIRPGAYTVVVWGFTGSDARARAFGCQGSVDVRDGEKSEVMIELVSI